MATHRKPPQAIESEQAILGAMLQSKEAIDDVVEILSDEDFYVPKHQKIFRGILNLYDNNEAVDFATLSHDLESKGEFKDISRTYLIDLTDGFVSSTNVKYHAKAIIDKSILRRLIESCQETITSAYNGEDEVHDIADKAEKKIFSARERHIKGDIVQAKDIVGDAFERMGEYAKGEGISGIGCGLEIIDNLTSGFQNSELIVIACRPSVGKTAFSLNVAEHVALTLGIPVLIFSLEMNRTQLMQRMICTMAEVSSHNYRMRLLEDGDWAKLSRAAGSISEAKIFIDDSPSLTITEMRARSRRMKQKENIGLIVADYLQLMTGPKSESRQQEITAISKSLKALARELNIPVIALSQLSRLIEGRGKEAKPQLSDLRESGAIEQDADVVIFLHRPRDKNNMYFETTYVLIAKQRNGPTDTVKLIFRKDYTKFIPYNEDLDDELKERKKNAKGT